jgi:hypothetical protein
MGFVQIIAFSRGIDMRLQAYLQMKHPVNAGYEAQMEERGRSCGGRRRLTGAYGLSGGVQREDVMPLPKQDLHELRFGGSHTLGGKAVLPRQ